MKPELHALVTKMTGDGEMAFSRFLPLKEAVELRLEDSRYIVLIDYDDEIQLAAWLREQQPWNQPRWSETSE